MRTPAHTPKLQTETHHWLGDVYLWLPLALASWWLAYVLRDPFITDWDGFDYTVLSVQGLPSALGLGRALFLGYNHWLWKLAERFWGLPAAQAYLLLRYGVIVQAGLATMGFYALYKELSARRLAALIATLLMAGSPYYLIYSGRGMSEIPAFVWLSWSLWWLVKSARLGCDNQFLLAAAFLGASANLREFAVFYFPLIVLAGRWYRLSWWRCLAALGLAGLAALAGMIFWSLYDTDNYLRAVINWYTLSANERAVHPVTAKNLWFVAKFAFDCSCVTALTSVLGLISLCTSKKHFVLLGLGLCGLGTDLLLLLNHDLPVNPRYLLTGLPGLAAVSGWMLAEFARTQQWRALPLLLGLLVLTKGTYNRLAKELYDHQWGARAAQHYIQKITDLPWHAAFIVGARTPLIQFYNGVRAHPHWAVIAPGAPWPDEKLGERIDDLIMAGRAVYVDFDPELWQLGTRSISREGAGLEMIRREFELESVREQLYRIVRRRTAEHLLARNMLGTFGPIGRVCSQSNVKDQEQREVGEQVRSGFIVSARVRPRRGL
ncbi:MAG: hypothetical protein HYR56_15560 [Acidobacteria bacterium]|nr:hypothetical protein [Acidobacteriota bacterium]MBI3422004.1 hypothetical protein [Acidobacteriota bacterium]